MKGNDEITFHNKFTLFCSLITLLTFAPKDKLYRRRVQSVTFSS